MSYKNKAMLCDYYELTMANGYYKKGLGDRISYFDVFFRKVPDGGGFAIAAGLEQVIEYVENGQIMYYDPNSLRFFSKRTGSSSSKANI